MGKGDGNFIVTWDLYGDVTFELRQNGIMNLAMKKLRKKTLARGSKGEKEVSVSVCVAGIEEAAMLGQN